MSSMSRILNKVAIGVSVLGASAIAGTPAIAGSITGASVSGPALLYEQVDSDSTQLNNSADLSTILSGDGSAPGGNVELAGQTGSSDAANFTPTSFSIFSGPVYEPTQLSGSLDGSGILLESLTYSDWFEGGSSFSSFGKQWVLDAWNTTDSGFATLLSSGLPSLDASDDLSTLTDSEWGQLAFAFNNTGYAARFSDPNVNYVNKSDSGTVSVGLAGHYEGVDVNGVTVKMSEVVKVTYLGQTHYLYGMGQAQASGLVNDVGAGSDGTSHDGLYNLTFETATADVPEPSAVLGLIALGGIVGLRKRRTADNA